MKSRGRHVQGSQTEVARGARSILTLRLRTAALALAACAVVADAGVGRAQGTPADDPVAVVRQTTDAVLAVLADKGLSADQKRSQIEKIVYANFDFETLSRLVLARNWKDMSREQQTAFVDEFKRHLSLTYGKNVESYNNERVLITGERAEPRGDWTVKTKIERPGAEDILVGYRLRKRTGNWLVIDVVIEAVSLVANYRSQFQDIITREGAGKLIELLREKNATGQPLKS